MNVVWNPIKMFDAFSIKVVLRQNISLDDALAVGASTLKVLGDISMDNYKVKLIFRSYIPNNDEHWKLFDDGAQILRLFSNMGEF